MEKINKMIKETDMAILAGGIISLVAGIIGIIYFHVFFFQLLAASIPAILILGGALAVYLGIEELKEEKSAESVDDEPDASMLREEVKNLKKEVQELKKEEEEEGEA